MTASAAITATPHPPAGKMARAARLLAITGLVLAIVCGIAELLAGLGYRWGWWHFRTGLLTMRWAASIDLGAVFITLAATLLAWKFGTRRTLVAAIHGLVLSLIVCRPPLYLYNQVNSLPRIHDISTDTLTPPQFVALLPLRQGAENSTVYLAETGVQQKKAYADVAPAMLDVPPVQALQRAEKAARAMGWEIVAVNAPESRIEATDTTLLFGFKDDVVIRVAANGGGSRIDVRSLSRIGRSDFGANAKRIRLFMRQLAQAGA